VGQYYTPIILDDAGKIMAHFSSHEYGNGLKLMECAWLDNAYVAVVEAMLVLDGARRVVWAGDYADPEPGTEDTLFGMCTAAPVRFNCETLNSADYMKPVEPNAELPVEVTTASHPFIVNVDKEQYIDKNRVPRVAYYWTQGQKLAIHPLPLLTCEGNGRGGGDYGGAWTHVGKWARDHIYVSATVPEGCREISTARLRE
jgi:hypothetical protein